MPRWLSRLLNEKHPPEEPGMHEITTPVELEAALEKSQTSPVFLFKHSTTCPISARAQDRIAQYLARAGENTPPFYLVRVIESRPISNEIATRLKVTHQSPQLVLVQGDTALWNASHDDINAAAIIAALAQTTP